MGRFVLISLLALPFIEIAIFIWVGGLIGVFPTLALIVLTAVAGIAILRWQGMGLLADSRAMMARGEVPARPFGEMMMVAAGGLLLALPGFFTDIVALALLIPPIRGLIYQLLSRNMVVVSTYRPARPSPAYKSIDLDTDDYR